MLTSSSLFVGARGLDEPEINRYWKCETHPKDVILRRCRACFFSIYVVRGAVILDLPI